MTQPMPPAQLLSGSLKSAPNAPTKTEPEGDFASAFRDQLDGQTDTGTHRPPSATVAEPDAALAAGAFGASSGSAIATAKAVSEAIAANDQHGPPGQADPSLPSGGVAEPVDRMQVLVGSDPVNDLQNFALPAADTTRSPELDLTASAAAGPAAVAPAMAPTPADSQEALRWSESGYSRAALQGIDASGVGPVSPATPMAVEGAIRNSVPDLRTAEQNVSLPQNFARIDDTAISVAASSARPAAAQFVVNTAAVQDGLQTASQSSMSSADTSRAIAVALAAVAPSASAAVLDGSATLATAAVAATSKVHALHTPAAAEVPVAAVTAAAAVSAAVSVTAAAAVATPTSQVHATAVMTAAAVPSQEPATAAVAASAEVPAIVGMAAATADTKVSVTAPSTTAVATPVPVSRTPNGAADFRIGTRLSQANANQGQTPVGNTDTPAVANSSAPNVAATQDGSLSMDVSAADLARPDGAVTPRSDGAATASAGQPTPTLAPLSAAPLASAPNAQQLSSTAPIQLNVDTPLTDPGWGSVVGARLAWGAAQGIHTATLVLNPRELGPVNVTLSMADDEASVSFVSQQALVRDAIEAALPRLRELFSGEGISLADVDISNGEGRSSGGGDTTSRRDTAAHPRSGESPESVLHEERGPALDSLVDTFA